MKNQRHTRGIAEKFAKTFVVKVLGMGSGIVLSIVIGRHLGPEGLGVINLSLKIGMILIVVSLFGLQNWIIREVSKSNKKGDYNYQRSLISASVITTAFLSFIIASLGIIGVNVIGDVFLDNDALKVPLTLTFIMLIPQTLSRVYSSALNGIGRVWQANLIDQSLTSILVLALVTVFYFFEIDYSANLVLTGYLCSRFMLLCFVFLFWRHQQRGEKTSFMSIGSMLKKGFPMMVITGTSSIYNNLDVVILASLSDMEHVGYYSAGARLALATSFVVQIVNSVLSPRIAGLYIAGDLQEMSVIVKKVGRVLLLLSIGMIIFFIIFGNNLLVMWGDQFIKAYPILVILIVGQGIKIANSISGTLLLMCDYEREQAFLSISILFIYVILAYLLILNFQGIGAAYALLITIIIENISKVILVKRNIKVSLF